MFSIENFSTLEIRLHRSTKQALKEQNVNSYEKLINPGYMLSFYCDSNQKIKTKVDVNAYAIANNYLEYRGEDFREELFQLYSNAMNYIDNYKYKGKEEDYIKIRKQLAIIINYIDIEHLYRYTNEISAMVIPDRLPDVFDDQVEIDGIGTRDQTYTKQDYKYLLPTLVMFKFIYPLIEEIMNTLEDSKKNFLSIQMLALLKHYDFYNYEGFIKLRKYVNKIIENIPKEDVDIKVLTLNIDKNTIPEYYLGELLFGKIVFLDLLNPEVEIVTSIFKDINTKLKNKGDASNKFRNNNKPKESEDSTTDKGSVAESFRMGSDITKGLFVELNYVTEDLNFLMKQFTYDFNMDYIKYAVEEVKKLDNVDISLIHINLLSQIIKNAIDCRGLNYLEFEQLKNCLVIGYATLMQLNNYPIANLFLSKRLTKIQDDTFQISVSFEKNKLKGHREDELFKIYPVQKNITERIRKDSISTEYVITGWVNDISQEINSCRWQPPTGVNISDILVPDLKAKIVDMLIDVYYLQNKANKLGN